MKKYYFSNEQMDTAAKLAAELREEVNPELTVTQNMVNSLKMRVTNLDAEQIVNRLQGGIDTFHKLYQEAQEQELSEVIKRELDRILEGRSEQEQKEILLGILESYAAAVGQEFSWIEQVDLEIMKEAVCTYFSEYSMMNLNADAGSILKKLDEQSVASITAALEQKQLEEYAALAMYILKITGESDQIPDYMKPEDIGAVTAASLEAQKSFFAMAQGKIDFDKLMKVLKVITGVVMVVLLGFAAYYGLIGSAMCVAAGAYMFVEISSLSGLMLAAGMCIAGVVGLSAATVGTIYGGTLAVEWSGLLDALDVAAQKTDAYIRDTLIPAVKRFWEKLRNGWIGADAPETCIVEAVKEVEVTECEEEESEEEESEEEEFEEEAAPEASAS